MSATGVCKLLSTTSSAIARLLEAAVPAGVCTALSRRAVVAAVHVRDAAGDDCLAPKADAELGAGECGPESAFRGGGLAPHGGREAELAHWRRRSAPPLAS